MPARYKTAYEAVKQNQRAAAIAAPSDPTIDLDDQNPLKSKQKETEIVGWVTTLPTGRHG